MLRNSLFKFIARGATWTIVAVAIAALAGNVRGDERIHWQQVQGGQLKLDGKPPITWNVYQPEKSQKKLNLVLILLGRRYLAIDFKAKLVYQVAPTDLTPVGKDFESGDLFTKDRLLPSDEWTVRDVGPAELIKVRLKDYGRHLEISLPHPPDLRAFY